MTQTWLRSRTTRFYRFKLEFKIWFVLAVPIQINTPLHLCNYPSCRELHSPWLNLVDLAAVSCMSSESRFHTPITEDGWHCVAANFDSPRMGFDSLLDYDKLEKLEALGSQATCTTMLQHRGSLTSLSATHLDKTAFDSFFSLPVQFVDATNGAASIDASTATTIQLLLLRLEPKLEYLVEILAGISWALHSQKSAMSHLVASFPSNC